MFKTIRAKIIVAGVAVVGLCLSMGAAGYWVDVTMGRALESSQRSSEVLRNHMRADMMHDALRSDALAALLSIDPQSGIALADVKADLAEHSAVFRESVAANETLAEDAATRRALAEVKPSLDAYIISAERIVALSSSNADLARAELTPFMADFTDLETRMEKAGDDISAVAAATKVEAEAKAVLGRNLIVGMMIGGLLVAGAMIMAALAQIVRPIMSLTNTMLALARGETNVDMSSAKRADEVGAISRAVQALQTLIADRTRAEAEAVLRQREAADQERERADAVRAANAREQAVVVEALASGLEHLAKGNLTYAIRADFPGDYAKLKADFNLAIEQMREAMSDVVGNVGAIRSGSGEISHAADDLSRRTEQQAASLEETAAALDEITATVSRTATGASQALAAVKAAKGDAETSGVVVSEAIEAMGAIEKSAREISQIIGVIDEIAFQTNLLALNAGVEAARAGEAGRGFAVVAQEVRALAQRSAEAAKEIKVLISASTRQVSSGVGLVGQTGEALQSIMARVNEINSLISEIAASASEQSTGLLEVNTAVNQMDQVTQQNAAMVEQSTAASHALAQEAEQLQRSVSRFQVESTGYRGDDVALQQAA